MAHVPKHFQCKACKGKFFSPLPDGTIYFHACPPLSTAELIDLAQLDPGALPPDVVTVALAAKGAQLLDPANPTPADKAVRQLATLALRRPGHVDQNVASLGPIREDDPPIGELSTGAGVEEVQP